MNKQIRISCIGDSITAGTRCSGESGTSDRDGKSYPCRLQYYLDEIKGIDSCFVMNFGRPCASAIESPAISDCPYVLQEEYKNSLVSKPDIVLMMFGANDANWWDKYGNVIEPDFIKSYLRLINDYRMLPSHPKVIVFSPIIAIRPKINRVYNERLLYLIRQMAVNEQLDLFEMQDYTVSEGWTIGNQMFDDLHPNDRGYDLLAKKITELLISGKYLD